MLALGVFLVAERANATLQEVAESGEQGYLSLRADPHPFLWQDARPGEQKYWLIEASLNDAHEGTLSLELRAEGELVTVADMAASVVTCSTPFVSAAESSDPDAGPTCSGEIIEILPTTPLAALEQSGQVFPLANLHEDEPRNLLVTLSIPGSVALETVNDASATLAIGLHASGDLPDNPGPEPALVQTGSNALALAVLAIRLIGLGLSVRWCRRARRGPIT